jgi:hypothetical protein
MTTIHRTVDVDVLSDQERINLVRDEINDLAEQVHLVENAKTGDLDTPKEFVTTFPKPTPEEALGEAYGLRDELSEDTQYEASAELTGVEYASNEFINWYEVRLLIE